MTNERYHKLYKMYEVETGHKYNGMSIKKECKIKTTDKYEYGIFKEKLDKNSKDHIMEQFAYELAEILGVECCKASCRMCNGIVGSFSRFESEERNEVLYSKVMGASIMEAEEIIRETIIRTKGINSFTVRLYKYIIFDYIVGQIDRHLENLAIFKDTKTNKIKWYPLFDNGMCCFATLKNDTAITMLNYGYYVSRMGTSSDIISTIEKYRNIIWPRDLREIIHYDRISTDVTTQLLNKASKYDKLGKERIKATVGFVMNQIQNIHRINIGEDIIYYGED